MSERYDFSGYATKNDLKCADGRTIRKGAFKDCDGLTVPLVWGHNHGKPGDILGYAVLENREDGVYAYGSFNETESGQNAKELVRHGDIRALSIYANNLVQKGRDVLHGMIREVSLCLAGANPGARIEELSFEHHDDEEAEFEALVFNGYNIELSHSDKDDEDEDDEEEYEDEEEYDEDYEDDEDEDDEDDDDEDDEDDDEDDEDEDVRHGYYDYDDADVLMHADNYGEASNMGDDRTVREIFENFTDEEKNVVYYMIGEAIKAAGDEANEVLDNEVEEMKHNLFEYMQPDDVITHDMLATVIDDAKKYGSLKDSYEHHMEDGVLAHAVDTTGMDIPTTSYADYAENYGYGINGVDYLFPDARTLNNIPEFIQRNMDWVNVVLNGVHRTPFSRIKSIIANITEDEARAKGYLKGNMKKNEFFSLMKRTTVPQTIYKKQKMDRDDVVDITDFDVVAWIKSEMRMMLNEEIARAVLIGDGRSDIDEDRISEEHIRPIATDVDLFTIKRTVPSGATVEATAKNFMKAAIRARKDYKGSGNPTLFTTEDVLTSMLLIEDGIGHYMYKSESELCTALRVSNIVTVPVMENYKNAANQPIMGIIVNPKDYNMGADKGGEINMFDDFNIDYNQYIYLIETRCSGALTKPYSAIVLYENTSSTTTATTTE